MANEQNLIPMTERTQRERSEIARKGAIASNSKQKQKKTLEQLTAMMLNQKITDTAKVAIKRSGIDVGDIDPEDMNATAYMIAGQIKAAATGNTKAFECITGLAERDAGKEGKARYTIPITDITIDFVEVYRKIHAAFDGTENIREIISKGGRGSIKSNFWAAVAEETILNDPQAHVVYTRRYKTDLRGSVYNQFMKTIIRHDRLDEWEFTTSPMMAKYKKTGQCVIFVGADKPISLKSYNLSFGYVKLLIHEECDEMAGLEQMDNIEDTFLRSETPAIDVKVFNPPKSSNNFMNEYVEKCRKKEGTYICHSYYYNVPVKWLGQRFFDRAEQFKKHKPRYYDNNYLGLVTGTGGAIFENVEVRTITDEEIENMPYFSHGLDFGYEHPQTFEKSYYDNDADVLYCVGEVFAKRCKNSTFARRLKKFMDVEIIADSARPDSINEMRDWGFNITGAKKRWGNGKGRDYCWEWLQETTKIVVDPDRCPNLKKELTTLEHEQLADGTFSSEYPKLGEDCVMALIYGLNRDIMESRRNDTLFDDNYVDEDNKEEWEPDDDEE